MNEDILKMAREAGLHSAVLLHLYDGREATLTDNECDELRRLARFASLVAAAEREACAKVCDGWAKYGIPAAVACADEIRARSKE